MSRTGITPAQVFAAAQALADTEQPVTAQGVRDALGGGSFSTISQYLRDWRSQARSAIYPMPMPPEVEAAATKAVASVWATACELARREIDTVQASAQAAIAEMSAQSQEALQEIARIEDVLHSRDQLIAQQASQIETLRKDLAAAQADQAAKVSTIEQLNTRIAELRTDLEKAQTLTQQKIEECGRLQGELAACAAASESHTKHAPRTRPASS